MVDKARNIKRIILIFIIVTLGVSVDLVTKYYAESLLMGKGSVIIIPKILALTYVRNTGAAFGFFNSSPVVLSVLNSVLLLGVLVWLILRGNKYNTLVNILGSLILAGGVGNLVDRAMRGYVVDFFEAVFISFPVFNFADILITCSSFIGIGYLIYSLFHDKQNRSEGS